MAAHRYWRLLCKSSTAGNAVGLAEIELRGTPGGADLTGAGTASASAAQNPNVAANLVDNSTSTVWGTYPSGPPQWWQYDLGAGNAYDIIEIYLLPRQDYPTEAPNTLDWQWSDDGSIWTTVRSRIVTWSGRLGQVFDVGPAPRTVLSTQEVLETIIQPDGAAVRVTQELLEVIAMPVTTAVRSTQEVLEVIIDTAAIVGISGSGGVSAGALFAGRGYGKQI